MSGFHLQGLCASQIGSDNAAAFEAHGWKVIFNPKVSDLKEGAVINWGFGPVAGSASENPYGHTGVIGTVKGNSFTTYEQNVGGVQIVQNMDRTWDGSITVFVFHQINRNEYKMKIYYVFIAGVLMYTSLGFIESLDYRNLSPKLSFILKISTFIFSFILIILLLSFTFLP
ncbi:CHAP domain-containing protein [Lactococcus garvieae]